MIAKALILLAVFAAANAVAVGAPWVGAANLGGVAAYSSAINHAAPGVGLGYAGAYGWGAPLAYGHGWAGVPAGLGVYGARAWGLGHGAGLAKLW